MKVLLKNEIEKIYGGDHCYCFYDDCCHHVASNSPDYDNCGFICSIFGADPDFCDGDIPHVCGFFPKRVNSTTLSFQGVEYNCVDEHLD